MIARRVSIMLLRMTASRVLAPALACLGVLVSAPVHAGPPRGAPEGPEPAPVESEPIEPEPAEPVEPEPRKPAATRLEPPRISGTYLGMAIWPAIAWVYSPNVEVDQRAALGGGGGAMRLGQAVLPWLTIGVDAGGAFLWNGDRFFMKGGLIIDFGFYPVPKYPFSIHTGFGFGAGLVLDDRTDTKGGVGGPRFTGALRYEFFPGAARTRPHKPGGWALGPELAWRGFTPAGRDKPMSNAIVLGLWFGYYWGR